MPPSDQSPTPGFARPSARVAAMPIQRGNYGVPPRQSTPQPTPNPVQQPARPVPSGPRVMDVASPVTPVRPAPAIEQPVVAPPATPAAFPQPTPSQQAPVQPGIPSSPVVQPPKPLFTVTPSETQVAKTERAAKKRRILSHWRTIVLVSAGLLCLTGMARWATAGSTANHIVAVGAVKANDGRNMTIQFVADDGKMHEFTEKSNADMIPGTASEVAYRSGAPEASVKRVAVVKDNRSLGTNLFLVGVLLLAVAGSVVLLQKHRAKRTEAPLTTVVTA